MIKNFLKKQIMKRQMKDVPEAEQEKMFAMVEKNPDLFQKIAKEIEAEVKLGKDQMSATMMVTKKYQSELQKLM
jgi:2-oxo-4-hydroxy-4-carboxy--5-ureidoimidazoline (OHCU) decarboxylase